MCKKIKTGSDYGHFQRIPNILNKDLAIKKALKRKRISRSRLEVRAANVAGNGLTVAAARLSKLMDIVNGK